MELVLAGTGTCTPVTDRTPACYFLKSGARRIIIDPGPGAVNRLVKLGLDPFDVDAIFISHHHLDHCADLPFYLFSFKYCGSRQAAAPGAARRRERGIPPVVVAPEGFKKVYNGILDVFGGMILSNEYEIRIEEVHETEWEWTGDLKFRSIPMDHFIPSVGYLFSKPGGPSLAYSGDTGLCDGLVKLASQADALLVECSVPDNMRMDGHMSPSGIAEAAIASGVKKVILSHFYPAMDPQVAVDVIRAKGYTGEIIAGQDGMRLEI